MDKRNNLFQDYLSRFSFLHKNDAFYMTNDVVDIDNDIITENYEEKESPKQTATSGDKTETNQLNRSFFNKSSNMQQSSETSTLSQDMVITGSLESTNNVKILGTVIGNVTSKGDVLVSGNVEGDIFANNLTFDSPRLNGNITVTDTTKISEASEINGNINSVNVYISGTINGNISSSGHTSLLKSAVVTGNIETCSLEIASGAIINGKITIQR